MLRVFLALASLTICGAAQMAQSGKEHLDLGRDYASRGQWKEAEEHYRIYRQANPASAEATVLHAQSLIQLNQPFDAVLELEELLATQPDFVPALKLYAGLLDAVVKEPARAEEILLKCARLAPGDVVVWQALAHHYLSVQKSADAIRCFGEALRLAPDDPSLVAGLAAAHGQMNRERQAVTLFLRAVKLNERARRPAAGVYLQYAEYLSRNNRAAESIPLFSRALARDPHLADAYYGRAAAYEKLKDAKSAERDALAAIREGPRRKDARQLLVRLYRAQNNPEKAARHAEEIEKISTDESAQQALARDVRRALRAAEPLLREGKYAEAAQHYEEIVRLLPTFYEAYFALGVSYSQLQQLEKAEAALRKYLSFQTLSADGHAALGMLLLQQNRGAEAKTELERALQLDPSLLEARKALGVINR